MNEYTRRDEVRWILISAVVLVACVALSLGLLLTAKPSRVPDLTAQAEARAKRDGLPALDKCAGAVVALRKETTAILEIAKASGMFEEPAPENGAAPRKPQAQPWPALKPAYDRAKAATSCITLLAPDGKPAAGTGWASIKEAADVTPPADGANGEQQAVPAKAVLASLSGVRFDALDAQVQTQIAEVRSTAEAAEAEAADKMVEVPLPSGLLGREVGIAAGVLLSLVALLVSFFSLRATSLRRAQMLTPYRKSSKSPERGLHAAMILRLATEPSGGHDALVMGAALGGLAAAGVGRLNADFYAAGVLIGALAGLALGVLRRRGSQASKFRARALTLAELEKPVIPIVLALGSVQTGLEAEFIEFFTRLAPAEAANAVEKLATQAEEAILAEADKRALS